MSQELGPKGRLGVDLVKNRNYDRAITSLEDGLLETPGNAVLFEYLGLAHLGCGGSINSIKCLEKAEEAMSKAIEAGGRATMIVDRSLEREFINPNVLLNVKRGWLHVSKAEIAFEPERPDAKNPILTIPGSEIKDAGMSRSGKSTNVFFITTKKEKYHFRTSNFSADEAKLLFRLINKYAASLNTKK